jgi:hypothetical protein
LRSSIGLDLCIEDLLLSSNQMINQKFIYCTLVFLGVFSSCSEDTKPVDQVVKKTQIIEPKGNNLGFVFADSIFSNMVIAMNLRDFYCDTSRLSDLAGYAYRDLRKTPFRFRDAIMTNELNLENHILNERSKGSNSNELLTGLWNGKGYFFAYCESHGVASKNGPDFVVEKWNIDTSIVQDIDKLAYQWREAYHPMPFYFIEKPGCVYVIYTRSVAFIETLNSVKEILQNDSLRYYEKVFHSTIEG